MGHHWLGRAAFGLSIAAIFTGIYIAAVGWGYYVAYGATLAMFLLLMAMKDVIDIFMVGYVMTGILYGCSSAAYLHILAMGCYCKRCLVWGEQLAVRFAKAACLHGRHSKGVWRVMVNATSRQSKRKACLGWLQLCA